jgi:hypothetical protein
MFFKNISQAANSKPKSELAEKPIEVNGCVKNIGAEVYNQNNIPTKNETSEKYQGIIKYFRLDCTTECDSFSSNYSNLKFLQRSLSQNYT